MLCPPTHSQGVPAILEEFPRALRNVDVARGLLGGAASTLVRHAETWEMGNSEVRGGAGGG